MWYVKALLVKSRILHINPHVDITHRYLKIRGSKCANFIQSMYHSSNPNVEEDPELKVDPRVEAIQDKLIYCDYLDIQTVRAGQKKYMLRKSIERNLESQKRHNDLMKPVYSIAVKYLANVKDDLDTNITETVAKESTTAESENTVPVYIPYANVDQYETTNKSLDSHNTTEEDANKSLLNETYMELYEKYLEAKRSVANVSENKDFEEYINDNFSNVEPENNKPNIPSNWMVNYEHFDDSTLEYSWTGMYGTPNPNINVSSVPCGGCGALLHCKDIAIPGYVPSEIFLKRSNAELQTIVCQRCHFLKTYNTALEVNVSADDYPKLLKVIRRKKCAVILLVDLTDFPCSIWPEISTVLHPLTAVFVVGNKIDLLPQDSPQFFDHVKNCLRKAVEDNGVKPKNIRNISLISAKTGYGIEELINKLHKLWEYKGDVYVIGCTNVGKSTLFNTLLNSDYCKVQATDLVQRATTSPWPGTTLNLLKFPILNPVGWRLRLRVQRLQEEGAYKRAKDISKREKFKLTRNIKYATFAGYVGTTFVKEKKHVHDPFAETTHKRNVGPLGLDDTSPEFRDGHWCYDTPGTIQPDQVLDLLTTDELMLVLPQRIISPRTFLFKPRQTIFLAGLGRLDFAEGDDFVRCTIFTSSKLPITMCNTFDADEVYNVLLQTEAFVVPSNNPERLKIWPSLQSKEMEIVGHDETESAADIVLSSAGWIAITPKPEQRVVLKAWTPQGRGLHLRTPPLLKKSVALRGRRIWTTPIYRLGCQAYKP